MAARAAYLDNTELLRVERVRNPPTMGDVSTETVVVTVKIDGTGWRGGGLRGRSFDGN